MDYTRLTQNGSYEGWIEVAGKRIELEPRHDRSARATAPGACARSASAIRKAWRRRALPQFYWLWSPLNFADRFMLYHNNADARRHAVEHRVGDRRAGRAEAAHMASVLRRRSTTSRARGTRRAPCIETRRCRRRRVARRADAASSISTCRASATAIPNGAMAAIDGDNARRLRHLRDRRASTRTIRTSSTSRRSSTRAADRARTSTRERHRRSRAARRRRVRAARPHRHLRSRAMSEL